MHGAALAAGGWALGVVGFFRSANSSDRLRDHVGSACYWGVVAGAMVEARWWFLLCVGSGWLSVGLYCAYAYALMLRRHGIGAQMLFVRDGSVSN